MAMLMAQLGKFGSICSPRLTLNCRELVANHKLTYQAPAQQQTHCHPMITMITMILIVYTYCDGDHMDAVV